MFRCKKCGREADLYFEICPECGERLLLSGEEKEQLRLQIAGALRAKEFETVYYDRKILAEAGDTESEREYARILERGDAGVRDPEAAKVYYLRASEKNDPYACYRRAKIAEREGDAAWGFLMKLAALLGCPEAYPDVAKLLEGEGDFARADYYRVLAADLDDRESLLELAKRRYGGTFGVCSEGEAKWYLERLGRIPLRALKLWRDLRNIEAVEPHRPQFPDRKGYLLRMLAEARRLGADGARFALTKMLSDEGDEASDLPLGVMYAEGIGTETDVSLALEYLSRAAKRGSGEGCLRIGRIFEDGELVERDLRRALAFYEKAAEYGEPRGLERTGDLYNEGELLPKNTAAAVVCYRRAAELGSSSAKEKADGLSSQREEIFLRGREALASDPEAAYKAFCEAAKMGYTEALLYAGRCLEYGIGTPVDRTAAFHCYRTAAGQGVPEAWYPLGLCYAGGIGIGFDFRRARNAFLRARSEGDARAEEQIRALTARRNKALLRKAYSKAMRLIRMKKFDAAAEHLKLWEPVADARMLYTLACLYEFGIGVKSNRVRSSALYDKARAGGFSDPGAEYKRMILKLIR